jgi:hypothetical protein
LILTVLTSDTSVVAPKDRFCVPLQDTERRPEKPVPGDVFEAVLPTAVGSATPVKAWLFNPTVSEKKTCPLLVPPIGLTKA